MTASCDHRDLNMRWFQSGKFQEASCSNGSWMNLTWLPPVAKSFLKASKWISHAPQASHRIHFHGHSIFFLEETFEMGQTFFWRVHCSLLSRGYHRAKLRRGGVHDQHFCSFLLPNFSNSFCRESNHAGRSDVQCSLLRI